MPRAEPYHHGDLRAALIRAGREILAAEGLAGLTLRAAARRAGVSHAAPYRHFPDGEALLAAIAAEGFGELRAALVAPDARGRGEDALVAMAAAYVGFALDHPAMYRLMFGPAIPSKHRHGDLAAAGAAAYRPLADAVAERVGPRRGAPGVRALTIGAWSVVHGLAHLLVEGQIAEGAETRNPRALARAAAQRYAAGLDALAKE
ncbi:MAG: TetR/AcrR family transcriptional regulator [Alphaproteobacteria bacterium]